MCRNKVIPGALLAMLAGLAAASVSACSKGDEGGASPSATPTPRPTPVEVKDSTLPGAGAFLGPVYRLPVNGIEVGYRRFGGGEGRPLVLVMGYSGTMSMWQGDLLRQLSERHEVVIFDNRGVGYSTNDPNVSVTIEVMAEDTAGLIDALGIENPVVVGWSMGGEISLAMAVHHPEATDTIITSGGDAGSSHYVPPSREVSSILANPTATPEQLLGLLFPETPAGQAAAQRYVDWLQSVPMETIAPEALDRQTQAEDRWAEDETVWDRLPGIEATVVVTQGTEDVVTLPENAARIAERIPGSVLEWYEGAGHGMLFQERERFGALVDRYAS